VAVVTGHLAAYRRHLRDDLGRADATIDGYLELLTRMDRELPQGLTRACEDELKEWINTDRHGRAMRNWCRTIVCGFFAWACDPDEPRLDFNPARRLPRLSMPDQATELVPTEQVRAVLTAARRPYLDWFLLASYAGLRCIEIAQLNRDRVTADELWILGKGGKSRIVPTHPLIWQALQLPPVFEPVNDLRGRPVNLVAGGLTRQQISHQGNRQLQKVLGQPELSMHKLRRWFGTAAYEASGEDMRVVQELLGHASVATTQRYVATRTTRKRTAVAGLPAVA
jgi:integrase/recombinase XerC